VAPGETIDLGDVDVTSEKRAEPKRMTPTTAAAAQAADDPAPAKWLEYAGSVVTPEGKPAIGARLYLPHDAPRLAETTDAKPQAVTDAEGKFRFTLDPKAAGGGDDWDPGSLIAVADGYGMAWAPSALYETSGGMLAKARARLENTPASWRALLGNVFEKSGQPLRLVADNEPIRGRVVDINGQPVAGTRLMLREVYATSGEDLSEWVEATKAPQADFYSTRQSTPHAIYSPTVAAIGLSAMTDADGRFTMRGIGRQRIAQLMIAGRGLQMERFYARTQAGQTIEIPREFRSPHLGKATYYAAELTYVAAPSKPIVGVVRDRDTREPLAGVLIMSQKRHGHAITGWGEDFVRTTTNAEGRYRLEGMPIGEDNRIGAVPQGEEPYMPMGVAASTDGPASEIEIDFDLPKGVWIAGRVTDAESAQGVAGEVSYFMFPDNEFLNGSRGVGSVDLRSIYVTRGDGRFRIPAVPGRGIVAFRAHDGQRYLRGVGAEEITAAKADVGGRLLKTLPSYCLVKDYQVLKEITPAADAGEVKLDIALEPQQSIRGRIVDPEGKPLSGVHIVGNSPSYGWRPNDGDSFEVLGYEPTTGRLLGFYHEERNLVGRVELSGTPPKDLVVTLQPGGKASGRVVDDSGTPQAGVWLARLQPPVRTMADLQARESTLQLPPNRNHKQRGEYFTDAEGKFEMSGLMPGEVYQFKAIDRGTNMSIARALGVLEKAIEVEPGQTLELGDVRIVDREE